MVEALLETGAQEIAMPVHGYKQLEQKNLCAADAYVSTQEPTKITPIQQFYEGQSVFITGGTGFLGKLLIEKLLRGCPGISSIYILVRPKKGKDAHQRIEELFDDPLFARLKDVKPKFRHQIVAIAGDCSEPGLGMSPEDRATLIKEVSIIFHVAATVRFDEKMKLAVAINVRSLKDVIGLCKEISDLKALVHVSTAYANCPFDPIEEKLYESPIEADKLMNLMDSMDDDSLIEAITPRLLGKWPNTYTYTKAVAENVVKKEAANLPIGIFRPAIVVSTYKEPVRGWIDNMYGPTGVAAGAGTGLLRSLHCDGSIKANIVPADLTVNALIASAWDAANIRRLNSENEPTCANDVPIYNYVAQDNSITFDEFKNLSEKYGVHTPTCRAIWYYSFRNNKYRWVHLLYVYLFHLLPALLIDAAMLCIGKQPRLLKIYKKIHKFMDVLNYFTMKQWTFANGTVKAMQSKMVPEDQENFFFDMTKLSWEQFFTTYIRGIRTYLIKDPMETLPQARSKWRKLYWIHQLTKLFLGYCLLRICWAIVSAVLRFL